MFILIYFNLIFLLLFSFPLSLFFFLYTSTPFFIYLLYYIIYYTHFIFSTLTMIFYTFLHFHLYIFFTYIFSPLTPPAIFLGPPPHYPGLTSPSG